MSTHTESPADLYWLPRIKRWRIKPSPTTTWSGYVEDGNRHPLGYHTIESARAALERRGFVLRDVVRP